MSKPTLRIHNPELQTETCQRELDQIAGAAQPRTVAVPLGKIVPLLLDAARHQRSWLNDFEDDLIRVDSDLYDVLLAYQQMRRAA